MAHRTGFAWVTALVTLALAPLGAASLAQEQEMSVPYAHDDGTAGTLRCLLSSLVLPDQTRVSIYLDEPSVEVSRDEPFYVAHGFGGGLSPDFLATLNSQGLVAFLLQHVRFELKVNGENRSPDYIVVDPASASIRWFFLFPANSLSEGVYIFEGRWWQDHRDVGCAPYLPEYCTGEETWKVWDDKRSVTVSVLNQ